jgi:hypothetical protein
MAPCVSVLSSIVGQPDANATPMAGGNYSLTGGFWALYAVQTPGAPLLTITYAGNQAVVSWPPSVTGWRLQTNANLAMPTWGNYLGTIVNNRVTNAPPKDNLFFRLTGVAFVEGGQQPLQLGAHSGKAALRMASA